jgi:putative MFS transporter
LIFFDFALIGFVLTFFVKDWHLTFGQSGAILFASGVAAIPGGILFGWLGDKIGRRKVFMMMILTLSFATGVMALAPENGWIFIATMRFIVGLGVGGLAAVDLPLLQEFVPASKRGWVSGLSIGLLPLGPLLAALFSASLGATIGWRGLFAIGLVPAAFAFVIRLWVPDSPRWLLGQGRFEEARRSLAWALKLDPRSIQPPASLPEQPHVSWLELFNIRAVSMQQTRYDTSDLVLAADPSVFSRFMISAQRDGLTGAKAIATGGLGAFIGFASRAFLRHDYLLGRANCQALLSNFSC